MTFQNCFVCSLDYASVLRLLQLFVFNIRNSAFDFFTCVLKIVLKLVVTVNMKFLFPCKVSRNQLHKAHNWAQSVEYDILEYMFVLKSM